jgi:hypothetical protein
LRSGITFNSNFATPWKRRRRKISFLNQEAEDEENEGEEEDRRGAE